VQKRENSRRRRRRRRRGRKTGRARRLGLCRLGVWAARRQ